MVCMTTSLHAAVQELLIRHPVEVAGSDRTLADLLDALGSELTVEEIVVHILNGTGVKVSIPTVRKWAKS